MFVIVIICTVLLIFVLFGFVGLNLLLSPWSGLSILELMRGTRFLLFLYGGPLVIIGLTAQILHQCKHRKRIWPFAILLALSAPVIIWEILDSLGYLT